MSAAALTSQRRRLYLMRHAQVEYFDAEGRPLDPRMVRLTTSGLAQASSAARALAEVTFDLALCSGLPRTQQTAEIVLGSRNLAPEEIPGFKEIRAGRLRDLSQERLQQQMAYPYELAQQPDARFLGGETFESFSKRVLDAWNALLQRPWSQALLVAHDAVNRVLLSYVAGGTPLSCLQAFEQDPACINVIDLDVHDGQLRRGLLRTVNHTTYDSIKERSRLTVMEQVYLCFQR